jgi:hypothetical protein
MVIGIKADATCISILASVISVRYQSGSPYSGTGLVLAFAFFSMRYRTYRLQDSPTLKKSVQGDVLYSKGSAGAAKLQRGQSSFSSGVVNLAQEGAA